MHRIPEGVTLTEPGNAPSTTTAATANRRAAFTVESDPDNAVDTAALVRPTGSVRVLGRGNTVSFGAGSTFRQSTVRIQGDGNRVVLGARCAFRGDILVKGNDQTVTIGDDTTTVGVYILCQEGCDVIIGHSCMFSRAIEIRTTDAHSLVDRKTRLRLNKPASVQVGDHVWVGLGVLISKGVRIPSDSVVAANAFVNRAFSQPGVVIAGMPAKVVREGITWHRSRKTRFTAAELDAWRNDAPGTEAASGDVPGSAPWKDAAATTSTADDVSGAPALKTG